MELLKKLFFSFCFVCCKFRNTDRMPDGQDGDPTAGGSANKTKMGLQQFWLCQKKKGPTERKSQSRPNAKPIFLGAR